MNELISARAAFWRGCIRNRARAAPRHDDGASDKGEQTGSFLIPFWCILFENVCAMVENDISCATLSHLPSRRVLQPDGGGSHNNRGGSRTGAFLTLRGGGDSNNNNHNAT